MKRKIRKTLLSVMTTAVSGLLACSLALGYVNDAFKGNTATANASMTYRGTLTNVTDQVSIDGLRRAAFDKNVVKENLRNENEERWVIVGFDGNSLVEHYEEEGSELAFSEYANTTAAKRRVREVEETHDAFLAKLDKAGIDYKFKYSYSTLNNGVAIKVKRKDVATISSWKEVVDVTYSESYAFPQGAVSNNANVYTTGIYNTDGIDYKGEGMKVAVLDTGLDFTHDAFTTMPANKENIWTQSDITGVLHQTEAAKRTNGLTVDQVYYNEKVPFAYDYADDDPDVYPSYSNHGTHVAGIVAGRDDGKIVNLETQETFVGVAPEAQLVICKVFTDNLDSDMIGGADSVDILAALADCATLGVDVINMSLGTSCGFSEEGDKTEGGFVFDEVYGKIEELGISLVVAASNDYSSGFGGGNGTNLASNPDSATVGAPATYSSSLAVASINGKKAPYMVANQKDANDESNVAFITEASDANGNEYDFIEQLYEKKGADKTKPLTLPYVIVGGVGSPANYTATVTNALAKDPDTIVIVKRGDITFAEKVENAMNKDAFACIIYNNVSGTIRMSLGEVDDPIPTCSIGMDAGKMLVETATKSVGTLTFSYGYTAGPFMSDFSSWGPTPDLKLKPEITAHGGEITSAVPGGYDEISGTSMASPNMAGAIALLRQHVQAQPENAGMTGWELNARVNQLAMSTTTMALNEEGNPYSPRKQGAGLARIAAAIDTEGYITVKDDEGNVSNKTKIELGDDDEREGVYTFEFTVNNQTKNILKYTPNVHVMTETLASDSKTVAEKAKMLTDSAIKITVGGQSVGEIEVPANGSVDVSVEITLSEKSKQYLDESFENGMFVEGFVRLAPANSNATVELGIPYLGFYGDWAAAPLFDYSIYELAVTDADPSIEEEDKPKATAAATQPIGMYDDDQYIVPLGTYLYSMAEDETEIYPSTDKASISIYDMEGRRTLYELYMIYAGLLRGAKTLQVDIVNKATGELIYSQLEKNVRKSYAGGGGGYGAPVMLEINPMEWDLSNNTTYTLTMSGTLDCEGGEDPANNTFTFDFTIDTEAPVIRDYRIRFEPYKVNRETKYRIYMDVDVYDNQYSMSVLPAYIKEEKGERVLTLLTEYPIPTYSQKGTEKTISFEVTDYYEDYILKGEFHLAVDDYALNQTTYLVNAPQATQYPDSVLLETDDKLTLQEENVTAGNENGKAYNVYELDMAPNELYEVKLNALVTGELAQSLVWRTSNDGVLAKDSELFAAKSGETVIDICSAQNSGEMKNGELLENTYTVLAQIKVKVAGDPAKAPIAEKIEFAPVTVGKGYVLTPGEAKIELHPNDKVQFRVEADPWYVPLELEWTSDNEKIFTVDENGLVTTLQKGSAWLEVKAKGYSRLKKSVKLFVGEELEITSYRLYDYHGGPEVVIPEDKNVMYLDSECFQNNTEITSVVLPTTLLEIAEDAFKGCTKLKRVVIPAECGTIGNNAFEGCTSLEEIVLLKMEDEITGELVTGAVTLGANAFKDCRKLKTIQNPRRITTANRYAFANCTSLESIDITGLRIAKNNVFDGCTKLSEVITGPDTVIGDYMFNGCTKLTSFDIKATRVGEGAFMGATSLENVTFSAPIVYFVGANAFNGTAIEEITLPNGTYTLGENAFANCASLRVVKLAENTNLTFGGTPFAGCTAFTAVEVDASNAYHAAKDGILYNKEMNALQLVPTGKEGAITIPDNVTEIGANVFAGLAITEIDLKNVTKIGEYAFANTQLTSIDLGKVTDIGAYAFKNTKLTTVDLAGVEELAGGVFKGCKLLETVTNVDSLRSVGAEAFSECVKLGNMTFESLTEVGAFGFDGTTFTTFTAPNLQTVGIFAFAESMLTEVDLPAAVSIGAYAFYNCYNVKTVSLGAVTEMGDGAFMLETEGYIEEKLTSVSLADGATVVGNNAFASYVVEDDMITGMYTRVSLNSVELPDTLKTIGDFAFLFASNVESVNLKNVENIGEGAFYGAESLLEVDLSSAKIIGGSAFAECYNLMNVKLGAFEQLGSMAFSMTYIQELELTNLQTLTFDDSWEELDDAGNWITVTGKKTARLAPGALAGMYGLNKITVKGEGKLEAIDNVLYANTENGRVLMLYPGAKAGKSYTVETDTVRIDDYAFYNTSRLQSITLPYTVSSIGSYAFFNELGDEDLDETMKEYLNYLGITDPAFVSRFVFEGVEAPVLEASYQEDGYKTYIGEDEYGNPTVYLEEGCGWAMGLFYSNFKGYLHDVVHAGTMKPAEDSLELGLSITYPENGVGYDAPTWKYYFSTRETSGYAAEYNTNRTIEAIAALPSLEEIQLAKAEGLAAVKALSEERVQPARRLYNRITSAQQLALVTEYDRLLSVEKAIRDAKSELGEKAEISEFVLVKHPTKTKYVGGEKFDKTGMILKVVYDDASEHEVTDYTVDREVLYSTGDIDPVVDVVLSYQGKTCTVSVVVEGGLTDPNRDSSSIGDDESPVNVGLIIGIVAGSLVLLAGAGVAVFFFMKKGPAAIAPKEEVVNDQNGDNGSEE